MHRSQAVRLLRASAVPVTRRAYAAYPGSTQPPPPPPYKTNERDNTLLYVALGLAAAGGAYFYLRNPEDVQDMKDRAYREATELKQKGKESADAVKNRADNVLHTGEAKFDQIKDESADKLESQKKRLDSAAKKDMRTEGRSIGEDIEAKYDVAKDATKGSFTRARDSTENLYNEARNTVDRKALEAREDANKKTEEVKSGLSSWFGWGKSSVDSGVHKVESEADRLKREAAEKVAKAAESVHVTVRAEKHA